MPSSLTFSNLNVAIVCDWLTNNGGAEKVIMALHELFPKAPIYTILYDPKRCKGFENAKVITSYLQKIPMLRKKHQWLLNMMPLAIESFDFSNYNLVLSSSHSVAKGIITKPETIHVCYCHTPMRYAWEHWELESRLRNFPSWLHSAIKKKIHKLRMWDKLSSGRVDHFIVNSEYVGKRVKKFYRRDSEVIHPPVDMERFCISTQVKDDYLMAGRLIPYKRFDLAIAAFNRSGRKLTIIGEGPERKKLESMAKGNISFAGYVDEDTLGKLYSECKALIYPQREDFGITPVEVMASGRPVIAFNDGGAKESVVHDETGILFEEQTVESLNKAVEDFEERTWDSDTIRTHAQKFSKANWKRCMLQSLNRMISEDQNHATLEQSILQ